MMAGKVLGLGFEIISKLDSYFLMTVLCPFSPISWNSDKDLSDFQSCLLFELLYYYFLPSLKDKNKFFPFSNVNFANETLQQYEK